MVGSSGTVNTPLNTTLHHFNYESKVNVRFWLFIEKG